MKRPTRSIATALSLLSIALVPLAAGAQTALPAPKDLSALRDTYWYVPSAYLPAYKYAPHAATAVTAVNDQTIWHITGTANGYITGCAFTSTDGKGAKWSASTLVGSVTTGETVSIGFFTGNGVVVGQGTLTAVNGQTAFLMQMSAMPGAVGLTHWAHMLPVTAADPSWSSLPGTDGVSVTTAAAAGC